jgi:aryl-alcohol dehydrogenase-like predicted oxidoreductase
MTYARSGRSGLDLPRISLGLWHNFGGDGLPEEGRRMVLRAFDHGITHFAQMAISWVLRDERLATALMGASSWEQIEEAIAAVGNTRFRDEESTLIDRHAVHGDLNLWAESSDSS